MRCNKSTCCGDDLDKEVDYCTKYVTQGSQNLKSCMNRYPDLMCMNSEAVTPDQCDDLTIPELYTLRHNYCMYNPNAKPKDCKKYMDLHCMHNKNANKDQCKDHMADYCKNQISDYGSCKGDGDGLGSYCRYKPNANKDQCKDHMANYCTNASIPLLVRLKNCLIKK